MRLRHPDLCLGCAEILEAGTIAVWDRTHRRVSCLACARGVMLPVFEPHARA